MTALVKGRHHRLIASTAEVPQFAAALLRRSARQWWAASGRE